MSLSDVPEQVTLTEQFEVSSAAFLLKRGLRCLAQGRYAEGVAIFTLAREQLSADQIYLATVVDTFIQDYMRYWQAQQAFYQASRRFAEAEVEQQARVTALEKLLPTMIDNRESTFLTETQPVKSSNNSASLQPLSEDFNSYQPQQLPKPLPGESNTLPALHFTCFGRFEVRRLGQPILPCSSRSGQSILRYLVAQPGHCATIDVLTALIWPEDRAEVAQPKLHSAISALRRSLNHGYNRNSGCGYVMCKNRVYYLNPAVVIQTDVEEFLQCYEAGQQISEGRVALYEKACRLYTGTFLPEDLYADWSSLQREHLNHIYLAMCRVITDHYLRTKRYEDSAKWATAILNVNRCDEGAHRQLIQIYAAQGLRSEALQQYQRCECLLREDLGVAPLPETMHVLQKLLTSELSSTDTAKIQ